LVPSADDSETGTQCYLKLTGATRASAVRVGTDVSFRCRSCGHSELDTVLDLGLSPLANNLVIASEQESADERFPLETVFCQRCALVQITVTVPPEILFRHYRYFSSVSETLVGHARSLVDSVLASRTLDSESLVIELASNDGYLLQNYVEKGVPVLGIDPAKNIAEVARERGIPTLAEFFSITLARELASEGKTADVVHANNVLAHVADTNGFVEGIRTLLKPTGVAVIEVPYVRDLIEKCEFDTIYHEHLCYFSVSSLRALFQRHGLAIVAAERVSIHGGSLRVWIAHEAHAQVAASVGELLEQERRGGIDRYPFYQGFGRRVQRLRSDVRSLVMRLHGEGRRLWGYGAAAKATVLLNYFDIGSDLIECVADLSPHKQGCLIPGVRIPIVSPDRLTDDPDYLLLLAWNFADEIMRQQSAYRARGGKFIIPVPELRIV
jgi:SAM-dependent methyltransferase